MLENRELQAYAEFCTEGRRVPDYANIGLKKLEKSRVPRPLEKQVQHNLSRYYSIMLNNRVNKEQQY